MIVYKVLIKKSVWKDFQSIPKGELTRLSLLGAFQTKTLRIETRNPNLINTDL